ncbi:MAG: CapA family protein [Clostridia bacterium]|nr:CapA family protein [Clostridia bacterium]MBQ2092462.1 CapA family protein [Clostridia bacterium]MBQ3897616.1 CapA family protein [Clostridia bacterium]
MAERERYQPKHNGGKKKGPGRAVRRAVSVILALLLIAAIVIVAVKVIHKGGGKSEKTTKAPEKTTEEVTLGPNDVAAEAKVLSTGDVIIHKMLLDASQDWSGDKSYDFNKHFRAVKDEISAADYSVVNLEVTLGEAPYKTYPTFKSPDSVAEAMKNAGFKCFVMANNHCYDSSFEGLKRTVSVVDALGVDHTGTRNDLAQKKYVIADVNGIKIGIVNYAEETVSSTGRKALNGILLSAEANDYVNSWYTTTTLVNEMKQNIEDMKADGAEAIILYIHWGVEYSFTPSTAQKDIAQKMCDLGVDVIIGGHPHVIQPAATLTSATDPNHHTFVVYSVGNLLSNQRTAFMGNACPTGHTEDGIFVYTTFTRYGDNRVELSHVDYSPLWVNRYGEDNSFVYEITNVSDTSSVKQNADAAAKSKERTDKLVAEGFKEYNEKYGSSNN